MKVLLDRTREQGYGQRYGEQPIETGAIAVPILLDERVIGCINMTFIASALRPEEAARQHLAAFVRSAKKIAAGVQQLETAGPADRSLDDAHQDADKRDKDEA